MILFPKIPYPRGDATCTIPQASYFAMVTLAKCIKAMSRVSDVTIGGPNKEAFTQLIIDAYTAYDHLARADQMIERQTQ
jgi:hypothetical protein